MADQHGYPPVTLFLCFRFGLEKRSRVLSGNCLRRNAGWWKGSRDATESPGPTWPAAPLLAVKGTVRLPAGRGVHFREWRVAALRMLEKPCTPLVQGAMTETCSFQRPSGVEGWNERMGGGVFVYRSSFVGVRTGRGHSRILTPLDTDMNFLALHCTYTLHNKIFKGNSGVLAAYSWATNWEPYNR